MSLTLSLSNALSGLKVSDNALQVIAGNIANANTPNYSRQVAQISTSVINGAAAGAEIDQIIREANQYLNKALQQQNSLVSKASTQNDYAQNIQNLLGQPGSPNTVDVSITNFFSALQTLAATPGNSSLQLNAVNAGASLAQQVSALANSLEQLRSQADQQISTEVTNDNSSISQLADVNTAINNAYFSGQSTAPLLDQRDNLLTTLGKSMDITYYFSPSGSVNVSTNGGISLINGGEVAKLSYTAQNSTQAFINNSNMSPILVSLTDDSGNAVGVPAILATGGASSTVTTSMVNGTIRGLLNMRDQQIPAILDQLDQLASQVTDQVNTIQNSGTGFPGTNGYTGTRLVNSQDSSLWSGSVMIGLVDSNGNPVPSPYADEPNGLAPLNLNLASLNTGSGAGDPTTQGIINAINAYYTPQNKAELGDVSNIQMISGSKAVSAASTSFPLSFNLENLNADPASFFVTGVSVADAQGNPLSTPTVPSVALASTGTYTTTAGSSKVTVATTGNSGLSNGETIYLSTPSASVNGIPAADLGGFFTVSNVNSDGTSFQITASDGSTADSSGPVDVSGQTAIASYATAAPGEITSGPSSITADFSGNPTSAFYTVTASVATVNADGTVSVGTVSYEVVNGVKNNFGNTYAASAGTGSVNIVQPSSSTPLLTAELVDANGVELPKLNGQYINTESGYLKLVATNPNDNIAINSLNSSQVGVANADGTTTGTNRGFSYYFGLNNFFAENNPVATGDTTAGSAINMAVSQTLLDDPGMVSTGVLTQSPQPSDPSKPPNYTYQLSPGDNSVIQQLANLGSKSVSFAAAGGLSATSSSLNAYAGSIEANAANNAQTIESNYTTQNSVLTGLAAQQSSTSGVSLDQEVGNLVVYQNAYAASAKVISTVGQLFTTLLAAFQG